MARKKSMAPPPESSGFRGFGAQALPFLTALSENNDRDWFAANKSIFLEELNGPFRELVGEVGARLASLGSKLAPIARNPVYRIYRDVRFSNDKSPYKTNLGAGFHRDGEKAQPGLVYIHVEPGSSFIAAGFYQPEAERLKAIRMAILQDAKVFNRLLGKLETGRIALAKGETLSRMPKGFEDSADSPVALYLKLKSFVVARPIADEDLESRELPEQIVEFAVAATPFLEFFWSRVD